MLAQTSDGGEWACVTIIIVVLLGIALYFLPTIIAVSRGHKYKVVIMVLNGLGGWTGICWVIALVWSVWPKERAGIDVYVRNVRDD